MTATNSATPSTSAAAMIIAVWIRAVASGWRAMPSVALPPMLADADAGADHREPGRETRADEAVAPVRAGRRGGLQQGENVQHVVLRREREIRCRPRPPRVGPPLPERPRRGDPPSPGALRRDSGHRPPSGGATVSGSAAGARRPEVQRESA